MRVLVLNASYEFLGTCDWKSAICAKVTGKAIVIEEYDRVVNSPSISMNVPAVIRLRKYVRVTYERVMHVSYSRRNVHLRDNYVCQYCSDKLKNKKRGVDHVLPASRGGKTTFTNTVTCCTPCNSIKDNRTPKEAGMKLIRLPQRPRGFKEIIRIKLGEVCDLWKKYL